MLSLFSKKYLKLNTNKVSIKDSYKKTRAGVLRGYGLSNIIEKTNGRCNTIVDLITASANDDMASIKSLIIEDGINVNDCDYDKRYPLHLAASEGHLDAVQFLVENGANVHVMDRWGNSPLSEAIAAEHSEVVAFLKANGSIIGKSTQAVNPICIAASKGDADHVKKLIEAGNSVNSADYENRTPLHLACLKGDYETVKLLIENGANVNAVDKNGVTPLADAHVGASMEKKKIISILKSHGAELSEDFWKQRSENDYLQHVINCIELAHQEYELFDYAEVWIPNDKETGVFPSEFYFSTKEFISETAEFHHEFSEGVRLQKGEDVIGIAWEMEEPCKVSKNTVPSRKEALNAFGMGHSSAIPILHQKRVISVLSFYSQEEISDEDLSEMSSYISGLINSAIVKGSSSSTLFDSFPKKDVAKMQGIFEYIVSQGIFNSKIAYQDVVWFYKLGISQIYFQKYNIEEIGQHLHALAAAKKLAQTQGTPDEIWLRMQNGNQTFMVCPANFIASLDTEKKIEKMIEEISPDRSVSVSYICSANPCYKDGSKLNIYILEHDTYVTPNCSETETSLWKVSTGLFLSDKSSTIRERYQELLNEAVHVIEPSFEIHEAHTDGSIPVTLTVKSGRVKPQLVKFTELCRSLKLNVRRKFIETFANDMVIYSFYIEGSMEEVEELVNEMSIMVSIPNTELIQLFIDEKLRSKEFAYATTVSRCIYYFLQKRDESVLNLEKALEKNPEDVSRFRILRTRLSGEAASLGRINSVVERYPEIISLIFKDFEARMLGGNKNGIPDAREAINALVSNQFDKVILTEFLTFNSHVVKTNFYKKTKSAVSFRLDPTFITESDFPENPYALFWVVGPYFQGFHIRFKDISRGGIRLILSRNKPAYEHNLATVLQENYGLAHTQNRKNKDIPEFGSKGTILLHPEAQGLRKYSFQSYIASLLDLLVIEPGNGVVDLLGTEELLFLGPDENTADLMEWAALYAKKRGYKYWKSFTTGKPPSMGGVPHDTYGMTTRSVHQYVLGCLEKLGLKEEEVTKFQTGGPDGDLGSNEILISKDKTISIVDGSGVIYDPKGLNREELERLAHGRLMIDSFDISKLGEGSFRVLCTEENVTLPSGEKVKNGLNFRNDFHLHPLASADMFVPCGGRPGSVSLSNIKKFFNENGKPRFKIIVEGANLFITQDARLILEKSGVVLYKDASANKGGVTSSSLEVLAALSLSEQEHDKMMCVHNGIVPQFYMKYVEDIQNFLERNARLEFEAVWMEHERLGTPRSILTDLLSDKINELCILISQSELYNKTSLRRKILKSAVPPTLLTVVNIETLEERIPPAYLISIFSTTLASRFVYKYGLNSNEFSFFEYLNNNLAEE